MSEDAALELSLLSIDALTSSTTTKFIGKPKSLAAVVWVDPSLKKSAKPRHHNHQVLHLPLSPQTLANPRSSLTVQILSSRLPFRLAKPLATALHPLSSIPPAGDVLTLPMWRPSGRLHGSLRISVRILWCLGTAPPPANCVHPTALPMALEVYPAYPTAPPMALEVYPAYPTAPPLPGRECASPAEIDMLSVCSGYPTASTLQDEGSEVSEDLAGSVVLPEEDEGSSCASVVEKTETALPGPDGKSAWRSFLTGLVGGTVVAVLVGAAGLAEG